MKAEAILKALGHADTRGMETDALSSIPDGGMPPELPADPETEAMGPPDDTPPVETGEVPEFDEITGLPFIAMNNSPEEFPAEAASNGEAADILDFIF